MRLSTSLIAVKRVTSPVPRSKFSDEDLEQSARLILEAEGVINPILNKLRLGINFTANSTEVKPSYCKGFNELVTSSGSQL